MPLTPGRTVVLSKRKLSLTIATVTLKKKKKKFFFREKRSTKMVINFIYLFI